MNRHGLKASFNTNSIKKDICGILWKCDAAAKQFHKSENKLNKDLQDLNNNNKILYSMVKNSSYHQ